MSVASEGSCFSICKRPVSAVRNYRTGLSRNSADRCRDGVRRRSGRRIAAGWYGPRVSAPAGNVVLRRWRLQEARGFFKTLCRPGRNGLAAKSSRSFQGFRARRDHPPLMKRVAFHDPRNHFPTVRSCSREWRTGLRHQRPWNLGAVFGVSQSKLCSRCTIDSDNAYCVALPV